LELSKNPIKMEQRRVGGDGFDSFLRHILNMSSNGRSRSQGANRAFNIPDLGEMWERMNGDSHDGGGERDPMDLFGSLMREVREHMHADGTLNAHELPEDLLNRLFAQHQANPSVGTNKETLSSLPLKTIDKSDDKCAVCLDDFVEGDKVPQLPCSHYFHDACVKEWLKSHHTCPTCRFDLPTEESASSNPDLESTERGGPTERGANPDGSRASPPHPMHGFFTTNMFPGSNWDPSSNSRVPLGTGRFFNNFPSTDPISMMDEEGMIEEAIRRSMETHEEEMGRRAHNVHVYSEVSFCTPTPISFLSILLN
jgi:hypothetical protein